MKKILPHQWTIRLDQPQYNQAPKIVRMMETYDDIIVIRKSTMQEIAGELYFLQQYYKDSKANESG